jgi:hypothetical protein
LKVTLEAIAYPGGHVGVTVSRITGRPGARQITQVGEPLMFNDVDEAKDAVDAILDRLDVSAEMLAVSSSGASPDAVNRFLQARLRERSQQEVTAVEAARWLDEAGLLVDSRTRPGKPLRDLLRAGLVEYAEQRPNRRWGRWFIRRDAD